MLPFLNTEMKSKSKYKHKSHCPLHCVFCLLHKEPIVYTFQILPLGATVTGEICICRLCVVSLRETLFSCSFFLWLWGSPWHGECYEGKPSKQNCLHLGAATELAGTATTSCNIVFRWHGAGDFFQNLPPGMLGFSQ